jgi:hypothetical protein
MRTFKKAIVAVAAGALVALSASVASAADQPGARSIDGVSVDVPGVDTSAELQSFLASSEPKTVTVDPATGDLMSVKGGIDEGATPRTVSDDNCKEGDVCLYGAIGSHPGYGFSGDGTVQGRWDDRTGYTAGDHLVEVTLDNGTVIPAFGPQTAVMFFEPQTVTALSMQALTPGLPYPQP